MKNLLISYQNAYDFKLRLTVNGQSVFCGFEGPALSGVSFLIQEDSLKLECDHQREEALKGIVIALSHVYQKEDLFLKLLNNDASPSDVYRFSTEWMNSSCVLVLIQSQTKADELMQMMHHLFEKNAPMTIINDQLILLVEDTLHVMQDLISIKNTLESELYWRGKMVISSSISHIENIHEAYQGVLSALKLMNHYAPSIDFIKVNDCWLMMMVDQLNQKQKDTLIHQLSKECELDDELMSTAQCFLENNLSISTTARALYVHRNTLIYRLDKMMQLTGLDIRVFEDAMKFKVLMTLKKK